MVSAIKYQADKSDNPEALDLFNDAAYDKNPCERMVKDKMQEDGTNTRRKIVDWARFARSYGQRCEKRNRDKQNQMDVTDYAYHYCRRTSPILSQFDYIVE